MLWSEGCYECKVFRSIFNGTCILNVYLKIKCLFVSCLLCFWLSFDVIFCHLFALLGCFIYIYIFLGSGFFEFTHGAVFIHFLLYYFSNNIKFTKYLKHADLHWKLKYISPARKYFKPNQHFKTMDQLILCNIKWVIRAHKRLSHDSVVSVF